MWDTSTDRTLVPAGLSALAADLGCLGRRAAYALLRSAASQARPVALKSPLRVARPGRAPASPYGQAHDDCSANPNSSSVAGLMPRVGWWAMFRAQWSGGGWTGLVGAARHRRRTLRRVAGAYVGLRCLLRHAAGRRAGGSTIPRSRSRCSALAAAWAGARRGSSPGADALRPRTRPDRRVRICMAWAFKPRAVRKGRDVVAGAAEDQTDQGRQAQAPRRTHDQGARPAFPQSDVCGQQCLAVAWATAGLPRPRHRALAEQRQAARGQRRRK